MKMTPVTSSNIAAIGYCEDTDQLAIKFKNGKTFVYSDVSEDEWGMLMLSDSAGKHFNQYIKAVKVGRELGVDESTCQMGNTAMSDKEKIKVLREALEGIAAMPAVRMDECSCMAMQALEATKDGE